MGGGGGGVKEKAKNKYRNLSEEEKQAKREYGQNRYKRMKEKNENIIFLYCVKYIKEMKYYFFVLRKNE